MRDFAVQAGVARAIDFAHPAFAERRKDFVMVEVGVGGNGHRVQLRVAQPAMVALLHEQIVRGQQRNHGWLRYCI